MKKSKWILSSCAFAVFLGISSTINASPLLTTEINGSTVTNPYGVYTEKGKVMLPIRWVAQELGAQSIEWDAKTKTVNIKMDTAFEKYQKLISYVHGLMPGESEKEGKLCPLSDQAKKIVLPTPLANTTFPEEDAQPGDPNITISVNDFPFAAYNTKEIKGHIFISPNLVQDLFYVAVHYDQVSNVVSIQSQSEKEIDQQLGMIEDALIPATPKETINLWGHGEQTRSGALQYAALSPALREKALEQVKIRQSWVTGVSSPWVGPITIAEENKQSETEVEYTITYPEVTSAGSTQGMEKIVIGKRTVDGKEGWFITKLLYGDSTYGIIPAESQSPKEPIKYSPLQ